MPGGFNRQGLVRAVGSIRFGAVLLLLLMVAMGGATVHESLHGTAAARTAFYGAGWFQVLLGLLAVNVAAAAAARFPYRRRHVPFLMVHGGIVVVLAGALATRLFGIRGQLALVTGETGTEFAVPGERLLLQAEDGALATANLERALGNGLDAVDSPAAGELALGRLRVKVLRYLPDTRWERRVSNDNPHPRVGLEVLLHADGRAYREWVFPDLPVQLGPWTTAVVEVATPEEWETLLDTVEPPSRGEISVRIGNVTHRIPLAVCAASEAAVEGTPYTVLLKRYLPHAVVGPDRKSIVNASDQPLNPAVEVEIRGPEGADTRLAFARFPDFHGRQQAAVIQDLEVVFTAAAAAAEPDAAIEFFSGPGGSLALRLDAGGPRAPARPIQLGETLPTPWPGQTLTVLRHCDHAAVAMEVSEQIPPRAVRRPALLVRVSDGGAAEEIWLPKYEERGFRTGEGVIAIGYTDGGLPLGFDVTLERFEVGHYPGGEKVRSYASHIRIADPDSRQTRQAVVSMNRPVSCKGYTLYQSSTHRVGEALEPILGVSRDHGRPVVFLGYASMVLGMAWMLVRRFRPEKSPPPAPGTGSGPAASPRAEEDPA
ncbi:MAG: cytochrome c biogenesis protein ResB [Lentisphaeria bacterium]|nr:cytochrome c biogenesis protein ResB [Lentisphaeria bacterium]